MFPFVSFLLGGCCGALNYFLPVGGGVCVEWDVFLRANSYDVAKCFRSYHFRAAAVAVL